MSTAPDLSRLRIDRARAERGGGRGGWWVALLLAAAFGAYAAWREGLLGDPRPRVEVATVRAPGAAPPPSGIAANGYVVARRSAAISTDIQGRVVQLDVEEGDAVVEGQVIARLDTRQLEASAERARADLARARARLDLAELEYRRRENLVAQGDVTEASRDQALSERDQARAQVDLLAAALREIEIMIDKSSIQAPFDGVVTAKNAEVGEVVSSVAGSANSRAAVVTVVDFDTLEVQVELAQTSLGSARVGGDVDIFLDAYPRDAYPGRVRQIWPTADRQKATVELRIEFLERDDRILPEMGVRVVFLTEPRDAPTGDDEPDDRPLVPRSALVGEGEERRVFVFADGRAAARRVLVEGEPVAGMVAVVDGLSGGERVVLDPPPDLADGGQVVLAETP